VGNVHKDELLPKMPHILKTLYDLDILDEKVIIDWGEKVSICLFFSCDTYDHFLLVLENDLLYNSGNFDDFFMISL
jgi:hypothetical protein